MEQRRRFQEKMSLCAAHIRDAKAMDALAPELAAALEGFFGKTGAKGPRELGFAFKNRDMLLVQLAMLSAMRLSGEHCRSRGSALMTHPEGQSLAMDGLNDPEGLSAYRYLPGNGSHRQDWLQTLWKGGSFSSSFVPVRPLPRTDDWFETTWQEYNRLRSAGV